MFTWTPEQTAVLEHFAIPPTIDNPRHLVVRARAGTGKTTLILEAVKHAAWAGDIALCAFNKRIADELQQRCQDQRCEVKTLHSIGFRFLRPLGNLRVESNREYKLAERLTGDKWSKDNAPVAKLAQKVKEIAPFGELQDAIELAWHFDCLPDTDSRRSVEEIAKLALDVCALSQENDGTISFADMLYLPLVLHLVRPMYDLVVVDETQDMSPSQILLVKQLVRAGGRVVVVGDDRQAIYGFRGADENTVDNLKAELHADELGLTVTHRCPKSVVEVARELVPDYVAGDGAPEGSVEELTRTKLEANVSPGDFVLSRTNAPLMGVCLSLLRRGVRARIQGKDIGKQLISLVRKMRANSVTELMRKLNVWREKEIERARERGNGVGGAREDNVNDTFDTLCALAEDVADIHELVDGLEHLFDDQKSVDGNEFVVCSSVHKAKGLEAGTVFVLADTLYAGKKNGIEEANIHYVAITRAKSRLVMVYDNVQ